MAGERAESGARRERALNETSSGARDRIKQAARELLATHRYADISVAAILAESGAAKGSFYFYFASKEDLLAALVREAVAGGLGAAELWTGTAKTADPVQAVRDGVAAGAHLWRQQAYHPQVC